MLPDDIPELYKLCCGGTAGVYWRYRGTTPSPSDFALSLWNGVVAQHKVIENATGRLVGLVVLYEDCGHHAKVGAVGSDDMFGSGLVMDALAQFIDHVFRTRPYLKLYFESSSVLFPTSAAKYLKREGVLNDYVFQDGLYADLHLFSLTRVRWQAIEAGVRPSLSDERSLELFLRHIADKVGRDPQSLGGGTRSPLALGFDSLDSLQVMLAIEELNPSWPSPLPLKELLAMPLADIHHIVCAHLERLGDVEAV